MRLANCTTQRRVRRVASDEPRLVRRMAQLASGYGRYGYRKVTALLREESWRLNHNRIEAEVFTTSARNGSYESC